MNVPVQRRFLLASVTLILCALLFSDQISIALVTRGDEYLQKGRLAQARIYYARALFFDRASTIAADRYAFSGLEVRTPEAIAASIAVASKTLESAPNDAMLLQDRGLLYNVERRYPQARADFTRAAEITHDPRWRHLAAWAAFRCGDRIAARRLWNQALHDNPSFQPARLALEKTRFTR